METTYPLNERDETPTMGVADYLAIARRRKYHFVFAAVVVLAVAVAVIFALPSMYRSTASILIESQQIPTDLVRSTISSYAEERIEFIRQKVLTRANIIQVIDKYDLYRADRDKLARGDLVERFRDSNELQLISADAGRSRPTIAFTLSFDDPNPKTAQLVANELVTMFLNENARSRAARAAETTEFLAQEGERIRAEIERMEGLIAEFKTSNRTRMPEVSQMNLTMLERLEREHQTTSVSIEGLKSDLQMLTVQMAQYASGGGAAGGGEDGSLRSLQAEYERLLSRYSEDHPNVRRLARAVEAKKQAQGATDAETPTETGNQALLADPGYRSLATHAESTRNKIAYLEAAKARLAEEITELSQRISQAPMVEKEYKELQRDLENLQSKYQEMKNKEMEARIAQNLEEERKGERFSLLEPPIVPEEPAKPDRAKLLLASVFLALAAGGGLVVLLELLDPALRGQTAFTRELGVTPLVTIPYISTMEDTARTRHRIKLLLVAGGCGAVAVLVCVHLFYMELDTLWYVMLRRISTF